MAIRFEFSPNEYFEDALLEKKFWYRRSRDGWSGLVSEPVRIQWKKDRDLTGGLLDLVYKAWSSQSSSSSSKTPSPESKALKKKIENTGMGGLSFFAWFGFIGRRISAEESAEATRVEREKRRERRSGKSSPPAEEEEEDEEGWGMELEIFPDGDDLAVAITEDLWPGAIKYFSTSPPPPGVLLFSPHPTKRKRKIADQYSTAQAQEQDALSDADFESDDEQVDENSDAEESDSERPAKKQRSY